MRRRWGRLCRGGSGPTHSADENAVFWVPDLPWTLRPSAPDLVPGTFRISFSDCRPEDVANNTGIFNGMIGNWGACCSVAQIAYLGTRVDRLRYEFVYLRQYARSRQWFKQPCSRPSEDNGWHFDTVGGGLPYEPAIWDMPGMNIYQGRFRKALCGGLSCGGRCSTTSARQDFQACAYGKLRGGGGYELIGCIFWGHKCECQHKFIPAPSVYGIPSGHCQSTCEVNRYPGNSFAVVPEDRGSRDFDPIVTPPPFREVPVDVPIIRRRQ